MTGPGAAAPSQQADAEVQVRRGDDALDAVAAGWQSLYRRCSSAAPFQTHAWLSSWWRQYGRAGRLLVMLVFRDGVPIAGAALHRVRRGPAVVLTPVGAGISDLGDVLVADGWARQGARDLAAALRAEPGWDVLDLPEVHPRAAAGWLREEWPGPNRSLPASTCLEQPAQPINDALARVPSRTAGTLRRKLKRIDRAGITIEPVPATEVAAAVAELTALHEQQWAGRGVNPEHLTTRFRRHLADALPAMAHDGDAVLTRVRRDGHVQAVDVLLCGSDTAGAYLYGFAPELREHLDVYTLLLREHLDVASVRGLGTLSELRGLEPHKQRLRPEQVVSQRLLLGRTPLAAGYAATARARSAAIRIVRRRAPALLSWLRRMR